MAITLAKLFMRTISQNPNENQTGVSLWTLDDIEKAQIKQRAITQEQEQAEEDGEDMYDNGGIEDQSLLSLHM